MSDMSELEGTAAIVTGASRGIGLAIARGLMQAGSRVCITARHAEGVDEALEILKPYGEAIGVVGKVDSEEHQTEVIESTIRNFGRIDFVVNNAAANPTSGLLIEAPMSAVEKVMAVNLLAPLALVQRAWSAWMRDNGGAVLNIASTGGLQTGAEIGAYNVSKAALVHLTSQLALELGPTVRVNALAPGLVKTRFAQPLYENSEAELSQLFPMRRLGVPEDISSAAVFLLSPGASWITGSTLVVDGGELTVSAI
jgi:NAD(P)-dependent dehydrogenase (short-subunit alcohol dehydrogenase family)